MATSADTVRFILDQLAPIASRMRTHKMFGEYALYCDEKVVGFICDDQLFIKITPEGKKLLGTDYQEAPAYPGSKPYVVIDGSMLENEARFCELITTTAALVPAKKLKKR